MWLCAIKAKLISSQFFQRASWQIFMPSPFQTSWDSAQGKYQVRQQVFPLKFLQCDGAGWWSLTGLIPAPNVAMETSLPCLAFLWVLQSTIYGTTSSIGNEFKINITGIKLLALKQYANWQHSYLDHPLCMNCLHIHCTSGNSSVKSFLWFLCMDKSSNHNIRETGWNKTLKFTGKTTKSTY